MRFKPYPANISAGKFKVCLEYHLETAGRPVPDFKKMKIIAKT
jgi:hypothetical protein